MNSKDALDRLCKIEPDKPMLCGIFRAFIGIEMLVVMAYMSIIHIGPALAEYFKYDDVNVIFLSLLFGGFICLATVLILLYALRLLMDGLTSILKPWCAKHEDAVYYHNGGLTNSPTRWDCFFGKKVTPVKLADGKTLTFNERGRLFFTNYGIGEESQYMVSKKATGNSFNIIMSGPAIKD